VSPVRKIYRNTAAISKSEIESQLDERLSEYIAKISLMHRISRQTDIAVDSEYSRLRSEMDEKRKNAWDMRGEVMNARETYNAELPHLCQAEYATDEAAMRAQAAMHRLERDALQQDHAKTLECK
jgi:hypothetical protein